MRKVVIAWLGALATLVSTPAIAQIRSVDPDAAAQRDVTPAPGERGYATQPAPLPAPPPPVDQPRDSTPPPVDTASSAPPARAEGASETAPTSAIANRSGPTWKRDDLIGAAQGVFGKGSAGLAGIIEKILHDQGEPNAYIAGREASGAFVVGVRYGSGTLSHKIEGDRPVYWTGPSVGFDVGGDAASVFVLVYNLYDSQELYRRYPQVEGRAYFVGGLSATYLRRGPVVLIPVRLGVGVRLGANIGYMKFSEKQRWLPF